MPHGVVPSYSKVPMNLAIEDKLFEILALDLVQVLVEHVDFRSLRGIWIAFFFHGIESYV